MREPNAAFCVVEVFRYDGGDGDMPTYTTTNTSLWPRQARPRRVTPKAIVAGVCVGIIAGISTSAVLSEIQAPASTAPVKQVQVATAKPTLAAMAMLTQANVAARPAPAVPKLAAISPSKPAVTAERDGPIASTDGRGGGEGRGVTAAAAAAAGADAAGAPSASTQAASAPVAVAPGVAAAPAVSATAQPAVASSEPEVKPVRKPQRVVPKRQRRPTNYSRNQNPFFPFFGGGNGFFFNGGRRG